MKQISPYLEATLLAIRAVEDYRPDNVEQLSAEPMRADAIMMRLQEIGEILYVIRQNFEDDFEANAADDWHKIIGLRHIISHDYSSVDLGLIWVIITEKLPKLKKQINSWLAKHP